MRWLEIRRLKPGPAGWSPLVTVGWLAGWFSPEVLAGWLGLLGGLRFSLASLRVPVGCCWLARAQLAELGSLGCNLQIAVGRLVCNFACRLKPGWLVCENVVCWFLPEFGSEMTVGLHFVGWYLVAAGNAGWVLSFCNSRLVKFGLLDGWFPLEISDTSGDSLVGFRRKCKLFGWSVVAGDVGWVTWIFSRSRIYLRN